MSMILRGRGGGGTETTEEVKNLFCLPEQILKEGGFPVHKFITNDPDLQKLINDDDPDFKSKEYHEIRKPTEFPWISKKL